jgi:hypothetical protein
MEQILQTYTTQENPQHAEKRRQKVLDMLKKAGVTAAYTGLAAGGVQTGKEVHAHLTDQATPTHQEANIGNGESITQKETQASLGYTYEDKPQVQDAEATVEVQESADETLRPERRPEGWHSMRELPDSLSVHDFIIEQEAERLGIEPDNLTHQIDILMDFFADVESDYQQDAANPASSARGFFQYLTANNSPGEHNGSIHTAIHRLEHILSRHQVKDASVAESPELGWAQTLYENPEAIVEASYSDQTALVLSDIIASPGTDQLLQDLASDDPAKAQEAARSLYYTIHHTNPDQAVRHNVERTVDQYFPVNES